MIKFGYRVSERAVRGSICGGVNPHKLTLKEAGCKAKAPRGEKR